jgi:hypothetical protein
LLGRWKSWRLGLAKAGHANEYGRPFLHKRVRAMLDD